MDLAVGDVDFYPNGGKQMPGCDTKGRFVELRDKNILEGVRVVVACNHMKAIDYTRVFLDNSADQSTCLPIAFACRSYELFERGQCSDCGTDGSQCAVMTLDGADRVKKLRGKSKDIVRMYFKTAPRAPYCLYHYNIEMKLVTDPRNTNVQSVTGTLSILINAENGKLFKFDLTHERQVLNSHQSRLSNVNSPGRSVVLQRRRFHSSRSIAAATTPSLREGPIDT